MKPADVSIVRYGTCLLAEEAGATVGELSWEAQADGWYVHMLRTSRPRLLVALLEGFRQAWREGERPPVIFHVPESAAMQRLAQRYGIASVAGLYRIADPDRLLLPPPHGAAGSNRDATYRSL